MDKENKPGRKNKLEGAIPGAGRPKGSKSKKPKEKGARHTVTLNKEADKIYKELTSDKGEFVSNAIVYKYNKDKKRDELKAKPIKNAK
jgi:hypothetical protein